jgi:hypothetical protein
MGTVNEAMLVEVEFNNGNKGFVDRDELRLLINSRLISSFKRADGWVQVDSDVVRKKRSIIFDGTERRTRY